MKRINQLKSGTAFAALFFFTIGCNQPAADKTSDVNPDSTQNTTTTKTDQAKLKEEIQARETAWSTADNARDIKAVAAFYADDAVSLENNQPMVAGRTAIEKNVEAYMTKRKNGVTTTYDAMDVFGCDGYATEVGKITRKDSAGKTIYTGKYMAVWEKRNDHWICIRDISNDDVKEK